MDLWLVVWGFSYNSGDEDETDFSNLEMNSLKLENLDVTGPAHVVAERWRKWKRSFIFAVTANGTTDKAQLKAMLLHAAGEAVQDVFESLEGDLDSSEADLYKQALEALDKYFAVDANAPYERHVFRQMCQRADETVAQFVTRLRTQSQFCSFTDKESQIRDQLLFGMRDSELRQKLLEEKDVSLSTALERARQKELFVVQAASMVRGSSSIVSTSGDAANQVHAVRSRSRHVKRDNPRISGNGSSTSSHSADAASSDRKTGTCYACGKSGHFARSPKCPARGKTCSKCGKTGHFAVVCKTKSTSSSSSNRVHVVNESSETESAELSELSSSLSNVP